MTDETHGTYDNLLVTKDGGVATVTINRPQNRNALSTETLEDFAAAFAALDTDDSARVIVVKGAGGDLCSGYDLVTRGASRDAEATAAAAQDPEDAWSALYRSHNEQRRNAEWWMTTFFNFRKPVIAQVEGYCLAGGVDLLGVCDMAIAADDAKIGLPQARGIGVIHTMGLLPYLIGRRKSFELCMTGDTISGSEAAEIGLVNRSVPVDIVDDEVAHFAERIAFMPKELLAAHKFAINRFYELMGADTAVKSAGEYDALAVQNPMLARFREIAAKDGMAAAFAWRDEPWTSQPPPPSASR